jgi:hypothetical protein
MAAAQFPPFECGDCRGDGGVAVIDALEAASLAMHPELLDPWVMNRCDVNTDGQLNIVDSLLIAKESVGLATLSCADSRVRVQFNLLITQVLTPAGGGDPLCAGICDVDTDGDGDAIASTTAATAIYENNSGIPDMPFLGAPGPGDVIIGTSWWTFRFEDLDADGDPDIAAVLHPDHGGTGVAIHRNMDVELGPGAPITFVEAPAMLPAGSTSGARDLALADVDSDGDLDLAVARGPDDTSPMTDLLFLMGPTGTLALAPAGTFPAVLAVTSSIEFADVNRDTTPDLVLGFVGGGLDVYLNDGFGRFTATSTGPTPWFAPAMMPRQTVDVIVEDLNRDRYPDVFTTARDRGAELWVNSGTHFTLLWYYGNTEIPAGPVRNSAPTVVADMGGDGLPDLILPCATFTRFLNLGGLDFWPDPPYGLVPTPTTTYAGDLDRNHIPDLLVLDPAGILPARTELVRP